MLQRSDQSRLPSQQPEFPLHQPELPLQQPLSGRAGQVHVEPSAGIVPANLLRMHIHFEHPCSEAAVRSNEVFRHLRLETQAGLRLEEAFLEKALWRSDRRVLTLLLRPERQLRGWRRDASQLRPVLRAGEVYRLILESGFFERVGFGPRPALVHTFQAARPRQEALDPRTWKVMHPEAGTQEPVVVALPHAVEEAHLRTGLTIVDASGTPVPGHVFVSTRGACWRFEPAAAWNASSYRLVIHPRLDDGCGNTPLGSKGGRSEVETPCLERIVPIGGEEQPVPSRMLVRA